MRSKATIVVAPQGAEPARPEKLLGRPGTVIVRRWVPAGQVEELKDDALLSAAVDAGAFAVIEFEKRDDAVEFQRFLASR